MYAFGQEGEVSWVREVLWERGVSKVHRSNGIG